ncbi:hypothetical protein HK101_007350 [Irineochytrium annulatum]|nr:hypothetical protein HK101_007350 [Irineochytrium annulatum]
MRKYPSRVNEGWGFGQGWESELPNDVSTLKTLCGDLIVAQNMFMERCKETIHQLVEEKHIALCKNRLLEQASGIQDKETSMRFTDQLQYWQDESERQTATIAYLKIRLNMLEMGAMQQEEYYRKNLADLTKQHTEQLQAIFRRNEETERAFLSYQKLHSDESAELTRLRSELSARPSTSRPFPTHLDDATITELRALRRDLSDRTAEVRALEDRLALTEKLKRMVERENLEIRNDIDRLRRTVQEEMMGKLQGVRTEMDERDETEGVVVFVKGEGGSKRVKGATPEKLVERLVDPATYDVEFLQVFMLTYKVFMSSKELMEMIVRRFRESEVSEREKVAGEIGVQLPILSRIVNTLKFWIENYWSDFQDDASLLQMLSGFMASIPNDKSVATIKALVNLKLNTPDDRPLPASTTAPPKPILPRSLAKRYSADVTLNSKLNFVKINNRSNEDDVRVRLVDLEPLELARQLTLIESELFVAIKAREFVDLAWMKDDKDVKAPNLTRMIQWSNHVIHWIITEIVSVKEGGAKARAGIFVKMVQTAQYMEKMNNFNGVKEVLAALQSSSLYRLKKTKELVGNKHLQAYEDLVKLTSSELNYKTLRARVHAAQAPLIPFPGVYQGDLVFLDTCSKDRLEGGLVNFLKFQKLSSYILEIQSFQSARYPFEPIWEIQEYIRTVSVLDDDQAYTASLACEPRQG